MDLALIDTLIRIVVPMLVAWNIFLFSQTQKSKDELHKFQLYIAEHYTSKEDMEKMLQKLEVQLEKQLNNFFKTIHRGE